MCDGVVELKVGMVVWWTGPSDIPGFEVYRGFYKIHRIVGSRLVLTDSNGNAYMAYEREVTEWP